MKANVGMVETPMIKRYLNTVSLVRHKLYRAGSSYKETATGKYCRLNNSSQRYPHVATPAGVFGTFSLERIFSECSKVEHLEKTSSSII